MPSAVDILKKNGLFPDEDLLETTAKEVADCVAKVFHLSGDTWNACQENHYLPDIDPNTKMTPELVSEIITRLLQGGE